MLKIGDAVILFTSLQSIWWHRTYLSIQIKLKTIWMIISQFDCHKEDINNINYITHTKIVP